MVKSETARILLVEDERPLREALADALSAEGFSVEQAATGAAGLAAFSLRESAPCCVAAVQRQRRALSGWCGLERQRSTLRGSAFCGTAPSCT